MKKAQKFAENIDDFEYIQLPGSSENILDASQPLVYQPKDDENWTVLVPQIVPVASVFLAFLHTKKKRSSIII